MIPDRVPSGFVNAACELGHATLDTEGAGAVPCSNVARGSEYARQVHHARHVPGESRRPSREPPPGAVFEGYPGSTAACSAAVVLRSI